MNQCKKILILIEWFYPGFKAGGPIQSCVNLSLALKSEHDVYVLTTDTDHGEKEPYPNIITDKWVIQSDLGISLFYISRKNYNLKFLGNQIQLVNADIVYLNLLFSLPFVLYPLWLKYRAKLNATLIVAPRGTLYQSAVSLKAYKKKPLLNLLRLLGLSNKVIFHATNSREAAAVSHYFPGSEIVIANNLPSMLQPEFLSLPKQIGSLKCIFIARIVPIKNLYFLLQLLGCCRMDIDLSIVGPVEDEAYWISCSKAIDQLPSNIKVHYLGAKENKEMIPLIQQHHLFILPTQGENFGHTIFESLLAARPVLISDQTPWLDLTDSKAGWSLPLNDSSKFIAVLNQVAGFSQQEYDAYAISAWDYADKFIHNPNLKKPYQQLFN